MRGGKSNTIDLSKLPYRGIFKIIAEKEGKTTQNIWMLYKTRNPKIVKLVTNEIKRIDKIIKENEELMKG